MSKRVQEILVQQGFGRRAEGDAQVENYASIGDTIQFFPSSGLLLTPGFSDLYLLASVPQVVAVDGSIYVPGLGPLYVLGMTEREVGSFVSDQVGALYTIPIKVDARILAGQKVFFMFGEVAGPGIRPFRGDITILDVFGTYPTTPYANFGKIRLIRADPRNPLIVTINLRHIVTRGISTFNLNIRENDIIYVPATFFGTIARFMEKLLLPISTTVGALFQGAQLRYQYDILRGKNNFVAYPFLF
jgi:protein involved in polysaccharide export with SLBB domain